MPPFLSLAVREVKRFLRQRSRLVGALLTPVVFWLLIGAGVGDTFRTGDHQGGYLSYFFPGALIMVVLFTAIFSTISVIEDRREGFLQGVLVTPVARWQIAMGKIVGGTVLASLQGLIFLLLAPLAGASISIGAIAMSMLVIVLAGFAMTGLGLCIAWPMSSTQGYHAVMNLLLMPMWFLSGSLFPIRETMFEPLRWAMLINPLTYAVAGVRHAGFDANTTAGLPGLAVCLIVLVGFGIAMLALASRLARRSGPVT